ncbi:MAG: hypothetical protein HRT94_06295 [Alphaproteobacteria bacterium]|nr:hypothetical protein [Alphaproteobacteria bacterium]
MSYTAKWVKRAGAIGVVALTATSSYADSLGDAFEGCARDVFTSDLGDDITVELHDKTIKKQITGYSHERRPEYIDDRGVEYTDYSNYAGYVGALDGNGGISSHRFEQTVEMKDLNGAGISHKLQMQYIPASAGVTWQLVDEDGFKEPGINSDFFSNNDVEEARERMKVTYTALSACLG